MSVTVTTPVPALRDIDAAGATLRAMRFTTERDHRFQDEKLSRELTSAISALMQFRLAVAKEARS